MDVIDRTNILIADDTQQFAEAMISVFSSPELAIKLGNALHELVANEYSLDKQTREGHALQAGRTINIIGQLAIGY